MSTYPTVRPSLTLDFQKSKQLDPRIAFSRSSTATYVDGGVVKTADEHQARFEKDGLLIEEQKTNYVEYSYDLNNSGGYWINRFGQWTITGSQPAPDGTNTAVQLTNNGGGNLYHQVVFQTAASPDPTSVTWSFFAKYAGSGSNEIRILCNQQSGTNQADFNTETGALMSSTGVVTPENGTYIGNGWYRFSITDIDVAASRNVGMNFQTQGSTNILLWGVQIEAGTLTSYIPTSGSTVTRAVDVAHITGDNFSSWFNKSEGTMFVSMSDGVRSSFGANFYGSHSADRIIMLSASNFRFRYQTTGRYTPNWTNTNIYSANDVRTAGPMKYAYAYKPYDYALSVKGSTLTHTLRDPQPNVISLKLGEESIFGGNSRCNCAISRISFYPQRITNEQLEAITS